MPNSIKTYVNLALLCLLFLSCNQSDSLNSYTVVRKDFVNQITVPGYLEAANSKSITTPQIWSGLTVLWIIDEGSYIHSGDTVCILEAAELENNYLASVKDLEIAQAEYNKTREDLNLQYLLLESRAKSIETSAAIKKLDSVQRAFVSDIERQIIELELEKSEIERYKIASNLKFLKKINESELHKTKLKIDQARNNMMRSKLQLDKLVLTSMNEGLVQLGRNWSTGNQIAEGDQVWGNMPLVNLPDLSKLQIRMVVSESHFKRISPGQEVDITVDAHPDLACTGKVLRKSPAGKPIKRNSKVKTYDIFVSIDSADFSAMPGLSVTCDVILDKVTDTLVVPLTAVFEQDTNSFVQLVTKNEVIKHPVKLSKRSDIEAVITEGINENDNIFLNYSSIVK